MPRKNSTFKIDDVKRFLKTRIKPKYCQNPISHKIKKDINMGRLNDMIQTVFEHLVITLSTDKNTILMIVFQNQWITIFYNYNSFIL